MEEVVSIPGRKLEEVQARLARITQAQTNVDKPTPTPPSGKSLPIPSPPVQQQRASFLPPADQKLELPSFTFPSVSPVKPAVVSAKSMSPPKEIPKLSIPPKVSIPELPKPKAPLGKEQKKDNFVFTEAALKDFIAKDKPKSTEVDKQKFNTINPKEKSMVSVPPVKGRPTFSLFGLGGGKPETIAVKAAIPSKSVSTTANIAVAPNGVPTISKWKLDPDDNSITGLISGSLSYDDGEPVTTSPIVGVATPNSVVRTKSGSRYFLGEEGSKGLFSFFGSGGVKSETAVAPAPTPLIFPTGPSSSEIAAEKKKMADKIATEKKRIEEKQAKVKRDALVQAQREAEKQASEDAKRIRDAQEEERRINAEKRKQVERQRQLDIDRQKQQFLKSKQSTPKEDKPAPSLPRPTISLFPFRSEESKEAVAVSPAKKTVSAAPRGVPTITKWSLDSDNAISGIISGSSSFDDGAPVTTSPIVGNAVSGSVVLTKSGSKYFLGDESSGGGFFSLFGGGKDVSSPAPKEKDVVTEARKEAQAKEAQQKAQAKANMDAEEKRRIAMEVAAKREAAVQARKQADAKAAAAKREAEAQARKQVEEDRKQAVEAQKRTAAAAAQKKLEQDKRQRDAEEKKRIDLEKSERQRKMQQAEQTISKSPRGVTVSLFGFGAPQSESSTVSTKASTTTAPPRGVPVISRWKQERDGSITGVITGSAALNDGDRITTSPIKGTAIGGTVVTTSSGSRYYLVGSNSATPKAPDEAKAAANARAEAAAAKKVADKAAKEAAVKSEALVRQKEATEKAKREKEAEAKRATLTMKQEREDKAKRASPTLTVAGSSRSPTISLFGLGGNNEAEPTSTPARSQGKSLAPKGVPTIAGWKLNRDGSISGRISGSPNFRDGEQVTTSPLAQGRVESGSTVKTGSGSRYFLS